jgi:hypothetical protein
MKPRARGILFDRAILKEECANPVIDYMRINGLTTSHQTGWWIYLIGVVHAHSNTLAFEVIDLECGWYTSISWGVYKLELSRPGGNKVR